MVNFRFFVYLFGHCVFRVLGEGFDSVTCTFQMSGERLICSVSWNNRLCNIGALIIRPGFLVYYPTIIIRNPQNPILIIQAPALLPYL